jgi:hypothetical protein
LMSASLAKEGMAHSERRNSMYNLAFIIVGILC